MDNLVLFCKTYKGGFERFKILKESVDKYNKENLPFYISVPKADMELFKTIKHKASYKFTILTDEEILGFSPDDMPGWISQQMVKMKFYKLKLCKFYLVLDSDSYFIRDFYTSDFMYSENVPYIIMHENKYFREFASCLGDKNVFENELNIKNYLKRKGKVYNYYNNPLFSSKVLYELEKNVDSVENLIKKFPLEYVWHGEYLLKSRCIDFMPCESFFKIINYDSELKLWKRVGENIDDIKKYYVGILIQDRWCKSDKFKVGIISKINRRILRIKFYIDADRAHIKRDKSAWVYYRNYIRGLFRVIFKGEI